ncbi:methyltransferase domain-containing protein [Paenibacillus sp. CAU 1523]|uniref:Methyltransferase domain-containing protein n=2 Tax=Paenibacillus arenosi TaxID=2774142 RepID=A0ABR9AZB8_9BACL|nr:methyltransferase domain-containing protein [Paenibacillus arenosi]MBD8499486.1 methyltransferase domain-containing protein [Paenibacillus arenosi]
MRVQSRSLVCGKRHSFDIAKHGYVNLLSRTHATKYDKQLFTARSAISADGFFAPMIEAVYAAIARAVGPTVNGLKMLDAGCGEGSLLSDIQRRLMEHSHGKHLGVGIDIAKEGISLASRRGVRDSAASRALKGYRDHEALDTIWCVADLANCPFANQSFDVILNVLSPANYTEFQRLLEKDDFLVKVVPNHAYLQQLRGLFYNQVDKNVYSNEQTLALFRRQFELLDVQYIQYEYVLNRRQLRQLIEMAPLAWGVSKERIQEVIDCDQMKITFDYSILIGKKNSQ